MDSWTHGYFFYTLDRNLMTSLTLLFKFFQLWPLWALSAWLLHTWDLSPSFGFWGFLQFLELQTVPDSSGPFPSQSLETAISPRSPGLLYWRMVLELRPGCCCAHGYWGIITSRLHEGRIFVRPDESLSLQCLSHSRCSTNVSRIN